MLYVHKLGVKDPESGTELGPALSPQGSNIVSASAAALAAKTRFVVSPETKLRDIRGREKKKTVDTAI